MTGDRKKIRNRGSVNAERSTPNGHYKNESGFTLLEVIIVLMLSLLILGLVMISFSGLLSSTRLQATVRDFSSSLRQARDLAKIHGESQGWTLDLDSREYGIEGRKVRKIPSNLELKIVDSIDGEIQGGKYHLFFEPNGVMEGAKFQLTDKKKTFSIELDPLLGTLVTR